MTDRDVEREIKATNQRPNEEDGRDNNDDAPIVDTLETMVVPVARGTVNDLDDAEDDRKKDDRSLLQKARDAARTPD